MPSRFTKRTFVWHKNTQRLETAYLIQLFSLNMNMNFILKLIQRFKLYFNFNFSSSLLYLKFFCLFKLSQIFANFAKNHATKARCFCFRLLVHFLVNRLLRSKLYSKWKIGFHLEDAGWIFKVSSYSKLEKGMELCKNCQVSGYFCLEQTSFLWIVSSWKK